MIHPVRILIEIQMFLSSVENFKSLIMSIKCYYLFIQKYPRAYRHRRIIEIEKTQSTSTDNAKFSG